MPKIKRIFKNNFTTVSNDYLQDTDLGIKERGLLTTMLSLPDNWDYSAKGLSEILPNGKNGVNTALQMLEKQQYLVRKPVRKNKKISDWIYYFSDSKLSEEKINELYPQNEDVGKEDVEKEDLHNETQLNTNEVNTDVLKNLESSELSMSDRLSNLFKEHECNWDGMVITETQCYEIEKLIYDARDGVIDSTKGNILVYLQSLYDEKDHKFKTKKGEEIKSLYAFVKSSFNHKTELDNNNKNKNW